MSRRAAIIIDPERLAEALANAIPQDTEGKIKVVLGKPEEITFKPAVTIPHNQTKDVWTVSEGKRLHSYGFIISTDTAGTVEIYVGDTLFHPFTFNEKKSMPIVIPIEFWLPKETSLRAKWISDTGSGNAYVTPLGYESEV